MDKSIGDMRTMGGAPERGGYTLSPGDTLGQYKIIRPLGRGGMGEVYEVEHTVLRKRFALKILSSELMARPETLVRFKREAQVMAGLDHPNILAVDEFGETGGLYWLRMECASGTLCRVYVGRVACRGACMGKGRNR
jgi:serine/threonine protein kinase